MTNILEKYAPDVTPKHISAMNSIGLAHSLLNTHRAHFVIMLNAERQMHNVGLMVHPTLYKDMINSESFNRQIKLINAAIDFLDVFDSIADEVAVEMEA